MLKLIPALKDYVWGGNRLKTLYGREGGDKVAESWEVSVHPDGPSGISGGGTLAEYLAARPEAAGAAGGLPVLIKYIDAAQNLSVQVHPDDAFARREEGDNGKTEMWYVIGAEEGAGIYCGFRKDTDKDAFLAKVQDGSVQELLNFIPVKAGDCFLIEAGTVHAIGANMLIYEVQQSSDRTYRLYAWGRNAELHIEKSLDVIDPAQGGKPMEGVAIAVEGGTREMLILDPCFALERLTAGGRMPLRTDGTRFYAYTAVQPGKVIWAGGERAYAAGESFLIPAALGEYALEGGVLYRSYYPNVKKSEAELAALGVDLARVGGKR